MRLIEYIWNLVRGDVAAGNQVAGMLAQNLGDLPIIQAKVHSLNIIRQAVEM